MIGDIFVFLGIFYDVMGEWIDFYGVVLLVWCFDLVVFGFFINLFNVGFVVFEVWFEFEFSFCFVVLGM